MKKLSKLNAKKIAQIENILGGRLAPYMSDFAEVEGGNGTPTTTHTPTKGALAEHYKCDHAPDTI